MCGFLKRLISAKVIHRYIKVVKLLSQNNVKIISEPLKTYYLKKFEQTEIIVKF
jgi:hypothetical protein